MHMKLKFFGFLLCLITGASSALAQGLPEYPGNGYLFQYNSQMLNQNEASDIKQKLETYRSETGFEAGILIVGSYRQYASGWDQFLNEVRNKDYTPDGLLLLIDEQNRKTHLFVSPEIEEERGWRLKYSNHVLDNLILKNFRNEKYARGFEKFIDYAINKTANWSFFQKTGAYLTMFLLPFLFLNPFGWILLVGLGYLLYRFIKKWWLIRKIRQIYENSTRLYQADFQGLKNHIKNTELLDVGTHKLDRFREETEQFFEQRNRTMNEAKILYEEAESLENEFTEFVNNAEKWDEKVSNEKEILDSTGKKVAEKVKRIDL